MRALLSRRSFVVGLVGMMVFFMGQFASDRRQAPHPARRAYRYPGWPRSRLASSSLAVRLLSISSELMRRRPLRHFHWLLHNDIEGDHEAENDRKEVDRQRSDVGCCAVLEAY
jgi:hypothetical protein